MARLLIIEDDKDLRETLGDYLGLKGHQVTTVGTLAEAHQTLTDGQIDLALLDLNLPDGDGLTLLRQLRGGSRLPVFVVSGRSDERSRLGALELCADDYIVKPVNLRELTLKIGNFLARFQPRSSNLYPLGEWMFCPSGHYLRRTETEESASSGIIRLTVSESCCLNCLCTAAGQTVATTELIAALQQVHIPMSNESLPVVLSRLRTKLQVVQAQENLIESVPRIGYRLAPVGLAQEPHAAR